MCDEELKQASQLGCPADLEDLVPEQLLHRLFADFDLLYGLKYLFSTDETDLRL